MKAITGIMRRATLVVHRMRANEQGYVMILAMLVLVAAGMGAFNVKEATWARA